MSGIGKLEVRVGLMLRRRVRARLAWSALKAQEFKGFWGSWFVVEGDAMDVWRFYEWVAKLTGEGISEARRAMFQQELWCAERLVK